jgi:putative intracellular protease/amidase/ribonuclease HI
VTRLIVEADGGSRGNPGIAGSGTLVIDAQSGEILAEIGLYVGIASNNVAEYKGMIAGVSKALQIAPDAELHVRLDSRLVVEQMSGRWKIKHPDMADLAREAHRVLAGTDVSFEWIPRLENSRADRLANEAMDTRASFERDYTSGASEVEVDSPVPAVRTEVKHIGVLVFDGVEELDAVGPWEVLAAWTTRYPEDGWDIALLSVDGERVRAAKGLTLVADAVGVDRDLDLVVHPGGQGTRRLMVDPEYLDTMRRLRERVPLMASVCTGSLVYAAAGLLAGRPATTHWGSLEALADLDPTIDVRRDERWVDDGDIVTSSGVSAGIDMALGLVQRLAGTERARQVRRYIQYDPQPPV